MAEFPQVWLDYLVASSQGKGHRLQDSLEAAWTKIASQKLFEVLCSPHPFTWFLSARIFRVALVLVAFLLFFAPPFESALWSFGSIQEAEGPARYFRFTARKLQNGLAGPAITSPGIQSFGVLKGNCMIPMPGVSNDQEHFYVQRGAKASLTLRSDSLLSFNGFYLITPNISSGLLPVEFTLESSSDGEHWRVYVMPSMLSLARVATVSVGEDVPMEDFSRGFPPWQPKQLYQIDWNAITCRWPAFASIVERLLKGLGLLLAVSVCLGYFLAAVVGISQFIVRVSSCNLKADYVVLIESLTILFLFPCPLVFHECLACHRKARKTAKLRQFRMAYNPVTEEDSRTDMDRIRALETFASSRRFRTPSKFAASEAFTSFASVSLAETKEITNFDQLNAQGVTMQKLLVDKLLVLVERLQTAHGSTARFEETPMKSFEASCEKILRKYHGDVARHTDLVRQSIMFDRIQDIADCLQTLMEDREVVIVSLKNRLAGRDKVKNLGHVRDVCLKARLITEQTRFYGICAFVCEIRLVLTCLQSAATTSMLKDLKGYRRMHQVNISIRCLLFWSRLDCSAWIRRLKHHKIHKLSRVLVETLAETGREAGSLNSLFRSAAHTLTDEERHKDLLRQRCLFAGDTLGKRLQELQHAVKKSSASSVLFTSIPCTLAMQKTWFKALLIIWGIFYAVRGFGEGGLWQTYMRKQVFQVRSARMIVLQRRQDSVSAGGNYSLQLGWMLNGCKTSSAVQGVEDGDIFYFSFPSLESANAFYFITDSRSGTEGRDPVRFRLDVTSASGSPWQLANTSWTLKSGTKCDWDRYNAACIPRWDETYPTDLQRGAENVISLVTPLYMAAGTVFFLFPVVLGCFSGPIVSILGRPRMGVVCFSFAFWGTGVLGIAAAISSAVHGDSAGVALLFFLLGWGSSTTGLSLVFWEEKFLPTVLFNACITVVASISFYFITLGGGNFQFPITGLVLLLMRRRAIHRAWLGIEDDVKYYNEGPWGK
ncbi:hypothetical protein GUITHDRAFT_145446 [Guillardia theta CCMP2712]|uniref:Uncharacterized protein n=1 Tax=Guillardia theta (strain CCMP2712) TaxID=905079 RepID=L1IM01_GUITC|nr:hypothetical protein GUITHDRAFT_145446 [Guillardia theta CCMP2712]EKX36815.1 hypothetical protein GUITHDRAFT_145446 [Guillardia theta CCMP2712]|eukprot:XP_005823795.1 hypothetical protein GUITHDRAFT_145446 [Guillardia theta CCMP2712]